ncbi:hypothetical protein A6V36_22865 [Paraburkholderia ginsengiterrae]|uniref:Uncharacterized protein n=1 Tax=Paraburkholderia ginsengiterrae TaxID=1462993 RepID=A0A1A9N6F7_9BURK|nr:hypothetical protein A6V37_27575 [Paraburkholderia ginsengiterrae]OAJ61969.1 hypothetical protein A6V36_22865 [Paraburkholderia ginsengiterrae]
MFFVRPKNDRQICTAARHSPIWPAELISAIPPASEDEGSNAIKTGKNIGNAPKTSHIVVRYGLKGAATPAA